MGALLLLHPVALLIILLAILTLIFAMAILLGMAHDL